jgi:hypothetical protein
LSAGASASPAGLTARARPEARPNRRAANLHRRTPSVPSTRQVTFSRSTQPSLASGDGVLAGDHRRERPCYAGSILSADAGLSAGVADGASDDLARALPRPAEGGHGPAGLRLPIWFLQISQIRWAADRACSITLASRPALSSIGLALRNAVATEECLI